MDHITRCPNCSTSFRVTEAQLAAYQGKVRCGKCAFVFNASQSLLSPSPAGEHPESAPHTPQEHAPLAPEHISPAQPETATEGHPAVPSDNPSPVSPEPAPEEQTLKMDAHHPAEAEKEAAASREYRPLILPEGEELFAPPPQPKHAWVWAIASSLTGLALLLQIAFAYRANLATEFPALQPRLASLCQTLGCEMPLPRKAEQLRSEWSELTFIPGHPGLVQLSATLRNLAAYDQALPLLEITLTDTQEQVVARRILRPDEYLASSEKDRPSLPRGDELHAFVQLDLGELKSTGYSLYWFYN